MDDVAASLEAVNAAVAAALSQELPTSPEVKTEFKHESPVADTSSASPVKRSRSPHNEERQGDEKRQRLQEEIEMDILRELQAEIHPEIQADGQSQGHTEMQHNVHPEIQPELPSQAEPEVRSEALLEQAGVQLEVQPAAPSQVQPEAQPDMPPNDQQDMHHEIQHDMHHDMHHELHHVHHEIQLDSEGGIADISEIEKMIQQAATETTTGTQEDHSMPDFAAEISASVDDVDHGFDISGIMASISSSLEHGLSGNDQSGMDHNMGDHGLPGPELSSLPQAAPKRTLWTNPVRYTRQTHTLPTLGKVAVDILRTLSENSLEDTITTLGDPDSEVAKEYISLKSFFDLLRKQFSDDYPLLYADQLNITSPEDQEIIRIANLATACASMFGGNELGWPDLDSSFLATFVPKGYQMPSDVAELYLGLKTQMFLTLLESEQPKTREQILEELFVTGQESALKKYHPEQPLSTSEQEFLVNAKTRKAMLFNESGDPASILALSQQYTYEAYLDVLSTYLNDNMETIEQLGSSPTSSSTAPESTSIFDGAGSGLDGFQFPDLEAAIDAATKAAHDAVGKGVDSSNNHDELAALIARAVEQAPAQTGNNQMPPTILSANENVMRATNLALQTMQRNQYHPTSLPQANTAPPHGLQQTTPQPQQQVHSQPQYYPYPQQHNGAMQQSNPPADGMDLPPGQSLSSEVLYERARQAAAARSNSHARREGSHSTRRPWSPEEEKALMLGLDMVKGPHWSQILGLFGPNGKLGNILQDRTQVQLKDKARNLKLFFLKTNSEMPYYLQCVTGELKTRAPTQAARKEAEERARLNTEEQQKHMNGIMTLNNMQSGSTQRPTPKPAVPGQMTPALSHAHQASPHTAPPNRPLAGQVSTMVPGMPAMPATQPVHLPQNASRPPVPQQTQHPVQQPPQHSAHQTPQPTHTPAQAQQQAQHPQHPQHLQQQQQRQQQHVLQQQHQQQQPRHPVAQQHQQAHAQSHAQVQPQVQAHAHSQARQPQVQQQPQAQGQSQLDSQQKPAPQAAPPKAEEPHVKHEPLNEEEAGILELKRLMAQESSIAAALSAQTGDTTVL